jgi:hypothetical protein
MNKLNGVLITKERAILEYQSREQKPSASDKNYWNNKWKQSVISYSAPTNKKVIEYVQFREISEITEMANTIISDNPSLCNSSDGVVLAYMRYQKSMFDTKQWVYQHDPVGKELWRTPEETLQLKYGDCDDYMILGYYVIRKMFMIKGLWEEVKHRLKCVDGHVFAGGTILVYAGRHAYLNWLYSDGEWFTVETTYCKEYAIDYFGKTPQRLNNWYGTINFTFNEYASYCQNDTIITNIKYEKVIKE